jgi:hypothetical protein
LEISGRDRPPGRPNTRAARPPVGPRQILHFPQRGPFAFSRAAGIPPAFPLPALRAGADAEASVGPDPASYKIVRDLETGAVELFDLGNDLSEKIDLARKLPEKAHELEALLNRLKQADAQMPQENPDYDPDARQAPRRRGTDLLWILCAVCASNHE